MFTSAGAAVVFAVAAISAAAAIVSAALAFSAKIAAQECFAFSAGKNFFRFYIKTQARRSIPALFIYAMVTDKVAVRNFLSALAGNGDPVRNEIMSLSAVFAFTFVFHRKKPFPPKINLYKLYQYFFKPSTQIEIPVREKTEELFSKSPPCQRVLDFLTACG